MPADPILPLLFLNRGKFILHHGEIDDLPAGAPPRLLSFRYAGKAGDNHQMTGLFNETGPLPFTPGPYKEEFPGKGACTIEIAWFLTMRKAALRLPKDGFRNEDILYHATPSLVAIDFRPGGTPLRPSTEELEPAATPGLPAGAPVLPIFHRRAPLRRCSAHQQIACLKEARAEMPLLLKYLAGPGESFSPDIIPIT